MLDLPINQSMMEKLNPAISKRTKGIILKKQFRENGYSHHIVMKVIIVFLTLYEFFWHDKMKTNLLHSSCLVFPQEKTNDT